MLYSLVHDTFTQSGFRVPTQFSHICSMVEIALSQWGIWRSTCDGDKLHFYFSFISILHPPECREILFFFFSCTIKPASTSSGASTRRPVNHRTLLMTLRELMSKSGKLNFHESTPAIAVAHFWFISQIIFTSHFYAASNCHHLFFINRRRADARLTNAPASVTHSQWLNWLRHDVEHSAPGFSCGMINREMKIKLI